MVFPLKVLNPDIFLYCWRHSRVITSRSLCSFLTSRVSVIIEASSSPSAGLYSIRVVGTGHLWGAGYLLPSVRESIQSLAFCPPPHPGGWTELGKQWVGERKSSQLPACPDPTGGPLPPPAVQGPPGSRCSALRLQTLTSGGSRQARVHLALTVTGAQSCLTWRSAIRKWWPCQAHTFQYPLHKGCPGLRCLWLSFNGFCFQTGKKGVIHCGL